MARFRSLMLALVAGLMTCAPAFGQGVRIDQLPPAGTLDGTESLPVVVGTSPNVVLRSATLAQITGLTTVHFRGAWSSGTGYVINDVVSLNGSSYIAVAANSNQTPPNATYWAVLATAGATGSAGADGAPGSGSGTVLSVTCGTGLTGGTITATGTCALSTPVTIARGGIGATAGSGTVLDNISGLSGTGLVTRSGAGAYGFTGLPISVSNGGTGQTSAGSTAANNIGALATSSNLSDLGNSSTARNNLGLGTFATISSLAYSNIGGSVVASSAEWLNNTGSRILSPNAVWSSASPYGLSDSSTIGIDFASGVNFGVTLAGNRTLAAPSNVKAGQTGAIRVLQDGTGSRTLSYNSVYKWTGGTACSLSTGANKIDYLFYFAYSSSEILLSCVLDVR